MERTTALGLRAATAVELKAQLEAERAGAPFLVHLDAEGVQRIVALALFAKLGVEDLPQNAKRAALVERALRSGLISEHEL